MNEITQSKSLRSILEDIQPLIKQAASMELISRIKYSAKMRISYWDLKSESSAPSTGAFIEDVEQWIELLDQVIIEKELLLEIQGKINYLLDNFAGFPDTFIDEDSDDEPSPF